MPSEYMRVVYFSYVTKMKFDEIKKLEGEGIFQTKIDLGVEYIKLNKAAKEKILEKRPNYFNKMFEQEMPNGVTYYGFMGKCCLNNTVKGNED